MVHYLLTFSLCFILAASDVCAEERALLQNLVKNDTLGKTVVGLTLSTTPKFQLEMSGQRIDLFLSNTSVGSSLGRLPQDGSILRILLAQKGSELMVSFLLARPPVAAKVITGKTGNNLEMHLAWNTRTKKVRPAIAHRLRGELVTSSGGNKARVAARSRYAPDMTSFFREYQTHIEWHLPASYTLPELPRSGAPAAAAGSHATVLQKAWRHGQARRWPEVLALLSPLPANEVLPVDLPAFYMLHSAALIQKDSYDSARTLYLEFKDLFPTSPHLDSYKVLLAYGRARNGDPYGAANEIRALARQANSGEKPAQTMAALLLAEVQLTIERPAQALETLRSIEGSGSPHISQTVLLRIADAQATLGQYHEAQAGYRHWLSLATGDILPPYSLVQLATILEQQNKFREATKTYTKLVDQTREPNVRALALFATARAGMKHGDTDRAMALCATIRKDFPGTEGACRAELMELDQVMTGRNKTRILVQSNDYADIAATAHNRLLREEAAFKNALATSLAGQTSQGLKLLQKFRRDFASGVLRTEAEILTLALLEPLVTKLTQEEKPYDAIALIEQNRDLLVSSTLSPKFATTVARAFRDLGLLSRSNSIYERLLNDAEDTAAEEQFYLPLAKGLYADGRYQKVLSLVEHYQEHFPTGPSLLQLQLKQGRALLALDRLTELTELLDVLQESTEVLALRNRLVLALAVRDGADNPTIGKILPTNSASEKPEIQFLRAEHLLQQSQPEQALEIFQQLITAGSFADLARYRSGQICIERGERQRGVNFLQYLVEKGQDPYWQNLAREMLVLASVK